MVADQRDERKRPAMYMIDIKVIEEILDRGNTAEVKKRKDDIIILEVKKKVASSEETD